ncbi:MAG: nucleoside triphosphate pyrophosphohydrolase [Hormoscilla sp. GUM202]|nr:nucleoside triphosphate pyrophosphohydrolase [Hormoscilla sp. GUM202]
MSSQSQTKMPTPDDEALKAMRQLIEVVASLRSPDGGCPWDLAQTPQTLKPYIIEEAYEVVHAIESGDKDAICEELGDLLLQVVLQAQIASEYGQFSMREIATGIAEKLIRRHPHVFADVQVNTVEEVRQNWEEIKAVEKGKTDPKHELTDKLSRYASTLPPLMGAMKMSKKAASAGFEWEDVRGVWDKFEEELAEFKYALEHEEKAQQQGELGDLLFTIINIARWHELEPSAGLQLTNQRFVARLRKMEEMASRPLDDYSLEELSELWQQAKTQLAV